MVIIYGYLRLYIAYNCILRSFLWTQAYEKSKYTTVLLAVCKWFTATAAWLKIGACVMRLLPTKNARSKPSTGRKDTVSQSIHAPRPHPSPICSQGETYTTTRSVLLNFSCRASFATEDIFSMFFYRITNKSCYSLRQR